MKTALIHHYFYQGGAAALALYSNGDTVIASGIGTLDYLSFLEADVMAGDQQVMTYRKGADHNSTALDAVIVFRKQTAGVWGAEVTVASGAAPDNNLTDPWVTVTSTGRILVGYCKISTAGSPTVRTAYFKYSDDDGDTYSAEFLFTSDQDTGGAFEGQQLDGPSRAVEKDGVLYKAMFGTDTPGVGGRQGRLYKSVDDGETWTFVAAIYPKSNDDFEEPCLVFSGDRLIASLRSDTLDETYLTYSDDLGLTWATPFSIGFASVGKSPLAISPDGMIVIMGRWSGNGGVPIYAYTNDSTGLTGWSAEIELSVRATAYMYGGINWVTDRFHFLWTQGVLNEGTPGTSGPTLVIEKEFIPSGPALGEPAIYTEQYQAVLDYPQGLGITVPTLSGLKSLHNELVAFLISDLIFDELDALWIMHNQNTDLGAWSMYNFKKPSSNIASMVNTPTVALDGIDFNGTTQYIDFGWAPSGGVNYQQNDASAFVWVDDNVSEISRAIGVSNANFSTQNRGPTINPRSTVDTFEYTINDDTVTSIAGATDSRGLNFAQRTDASTKKFWKNGVDLGSASVTSAARTARNVFGGATNYNLTPNRFGTRKISIVGFGSAMVGLEAQLHTRLAWYKTQVALL